MHNDDDPIGQVLSRREALILLGSTGLALAAGHRLAAQRPSPGGAATVCVARPEQTEGPYFVDERIHRSDIRTDPTNGARSPGAPLELTFKVSRVVNGACIAFAGAYVDVWQCDHAGVYSDVRDPQFNTEGRKFLRGYQVTDKNGLARFTTIYPGWYSGRAVHIHFKIRTAPDVKPGLEFTSQLYFDDVITDVVHASEPYKAKGQRNVRNDRDGIFRRQGGQRLMLDVAQKRDAFAAEFAVALT